LLTDARKHNANLTGLDVLTAQNNEPKKVLVTSLPLNTCLTLLSIMLTLTLTSHFSLLTFLSLNPHSSLTLSSPLILFLSPRASHLVPLILFLSSRSSHLILFLSSCSSHLTPLISLLSSRSSHLTPLISLLSFLLLPNNETPKRHWQTWHK
jgi:hypothetical protein